MRCRTTLLAVALGVLLLAVVGIALARDIDCRPGSTKRNPCEGTAKADVIDGHGQGIPDYIVAKAGNDEIYAFSGADTVYGGRGGDWVYDGSGDDVVYGGPGNDHLGDIVGPDRDYIYGGGGDHLDLVGTGDQAGDGVSADPGDAVDPPDSRCP